MRSMSIGWPYHAWFGSGPRKKGAFIGCALFSLFLLVSFCDSSAVQDHSDRAIHERTINRNDEDRHRNLPFVEPQERPAAALLLLDPLAEQCGIRRDDDDTEEVRDCIWTEIAASEYTYYNSLTGNVYRFLPAQADRDWAKWMEYAEEQTLCGGRGHLVTLTTEEEVAFVERLNPHPYIWLGALTLSNDLAPVYMWINNEGPVPGPTADSGQRWATGQPAKKGEVNRCVLWIFDDRLDGWFNFECHVTIVPALIEFETQYFGGLW